MYLKKWNELPRFMKNEKVRPYYDCLSKKTFSLKLKRAFDFVVALIMLVLLFVPMLIISIMIKLDSKGPVFFRQERVTMYGRKFYIHKFRTMVNHADKIGTGVTVNDDARITNVGKKLRRLRIDELPQLIDVLSGDMSFVGTRPESTKYVKCYSDEMFATLLMPAGITSEASIKYKDEDKLLSSASNADSVYVNKVLPEKMKYNLTSIKNYSFFNDIKTMIKTVIAVFRKEKA